jgi:PAS domain S-box-containing protein
MPRSRPPTRPPDRREQELARLRERVAELERALAEPDRVATALRESEAQFRALVASVPGMVYRSDARAPWRDLFVSDNVFLLCGHTAEELTRTNGTAFGDLILIEDRAIVEESISSAATRGGTFDICYRIRHADGRIRWVHDQGKVTASDDGTPVLLDGVIADITDRIQVELALRESEERYRTLVASVPGAVYLCEIGTPWKDTFMSAGVHALTGYNAADLLRPDGITFNDLTLPEDLEAIAPQVEAAVSTGQPFELRYRIRHADGSVRWVYDRGQASYAPDGTPLCIGGVILDITDRMRSEETLRESETRYRTLVSSVPGAVYLCEPAYPWTGTFMSAGVEPLTGFPQSAFADPGENLFTQRILAEDIQAVVEVTDGAIARGEPWAVHYRIRHADGTARWVYDRGQATYAPDGTPLYLSGVILDITDRMAAEETLRESEKRYRTLVANVPGAVYRCAIEYPYHDMFISEGMRQLSGHDREAFLGPDAIAFGDLILPEDRATIDAIVTLALRERRVFEIHYRIRHADGGIRWIQEQGQAIYAPDGTPAYLEGVMIDVTARTRAEEALRASEARLMEAQRIASTGSWELDIAASSLSWSDEVYRIFELDSSEFGATYEAFLAAVHPDDRELVDRAYTEAVEQRQPFDLVHRLLMPDGRVKQVHERAETHYDDRGVPIRSVGTVQDITEQLKAEEIRLALEAQLRKSQKMEAIGTLAGGIAHDFNNILAAVIGHAELVAQDLEAEHQGQEGIRGILLACVRAKDLVQQILTFSRLREQERRLVAVEPVILEALKLLRPTLPATIEIRTEIGSGGTQVLVDPTQLHQVVVNLCTNAAHAMRDHGGVLDVQCRTLRLPEPLARTRPGRYLQLTVRDTGHGMDPETLDRVFDPFFTTKPQGEGTGLGLAVVHGIVQGHDGIVTATSEPGQGTTFQIYFPAVEGRSTAITPEEGAVRRGSGEHILVVDDEPSLVKIASRILDRLGYCVTAHTRPAEALADFLARPDDFDLVLSDLTMPQMTGLDLAGFMLERRPGLPILLTSGYSGSVDPEELARAGIRELIGKPFLARTIADAVARALQRE